MTDFIFTNASETLRVIYKTDRIGDASRFNILDIQGLETVERAAGLNFEKLDFNVVGDFEAFATANNLILTSRVSDEGSEVELIDGATGNDLAVTTSDPMTDGTTGREEDTDVTMRADSGGDLNSKHWLLDIPNQGYYVWYNINAAGVDPAIAGRIGIEVAAATDAANTVVATATATAIDLITGIGATPATADVELRNDDMGAVPDAVDGDVGGAFSVAVVATGVDITPYGEYLAASGGNGVLTWSLDSGALPSGLVLTPSGRISGLPDTAIDPATFEVKVVDEFGQEDILELNITIDAAP